MDYENYYVFLWTDKQLKKKYSEKVLSKYYKQLAFLFQNGYDLNCNEEDIEEQFSLFNYFETYEDFEELKQTCCLSNFSVGKKIFEEELYDILKKLTFLRIKNDNPVEVKRNATVYQHRMIEALEKLKTLFYSKDEELVLFYKELSNYEDIVSRIQEIEDKLSKELKVISWIRFSELNTILYSTYIKTSKTKTEKNNICKISNVNSEIYGSIGGYNSNTGEIKCIIGSAVWELKTVKTNKTKLKTVAKSILSDTIKVKEDDEGIKYLSDWVNGKADNDEKAIQVVVNSLLFGILTLLSIKYNLTLIKDDKNSEKAEKIQEEFKSIMKYCNISKDYLL